MSTYHHTPLTPAMQAIATEHLQDLLNQEPEPLLRMQLSYLGMLVSYLRFPPEGWLKIREEDSIIRDTMQVCWLLQGLHDVQEEPTPLEKENAPSLVGHYFNHRQRLIRIMRLFV